ncbi:MAG: hypothetical protein WAK20_15875 [Candidatus Acidiferrum sp.]
MSDKKHDSSKETEKKNNPGSGQQNPGSGQSGNQKDNKGFENRNTSR